MTHHYGRHGPRAWLKWRKRHHPFLSSLLVPVQRKLMIFRIHIPPEVERALIVLEPSDERQEIIIMPTSPLVPQLPEPEPEEEQRVMDEAIYRANKLTSQIPEQPSFLIDKTRLVQYAIEPEAIAYVKKVCYEIAAARDKEDYLIALFISTCLKHIISDKKRTLEDARDLELLELARRDSQNPPAEREDGKKSYHKEHGDVIRAMEVLGIVPKGTYERLEESHDRADKYSFFYDHHKEMEVWPNENTFRSTRWEYL